nr:hypothetical protein [uncultured Steroidobacter sp.]
MNKIACMAIVLVSSSSLVGCEKVTSAEIAVETPVRIDPACIEAAAPRLGPTERFHRLPDRPGGTEFHVKRGPAATTILVADGPPHTVRMAFGWIGRESDEVERASLQLLSDLYAAIVESCGIQAPPAKITTRCKTRHCDNWMAQ